MPARPAGEDDAPRDRPAGSPRPRSRGQGKEKRVKALRYAAARTLRGRAVVVPQATGSAAPRPAPAGCSAIARQAILGPPCPASRTTVAHRGGVLAGVLGRWLGGMDRAAQRLERVIGRVERVVTAVSHFVWLGSGTSCCLPGATGPCQKEPCGTGTARVEEAYQRGRIGGSLPSQVVARVPDLQRGALPQRRGRSA